MAPGDDLLALDEDGDPVELEGDWTVQAFDPDVDQPPAGHHLQHDDDPPDLPPTGQGSS